MLAGLVSIFAATVSPSLGIVLMGGYVGWWSISLLQCARNSAFEILAPGLLVLGLLASFVSFSELIVLFLVQFIVFCLASFVFSGFAAKGRIRVSPAMARGLHRARSVDIGIQELPDARQRREDEVARFLEELRAYPGDSRGVGM